MIEIKCNVCKKQIIGELHVEKNTLTGFYKDNNNRIIYRYAINVIPATDHYHVCRDCISRKIIEDHSVNVQMLEHEHVEQVK